MQPKAALTCMRSDTSRAQSYPVEQRNVVKQVGVGKRNHTEIFAELWTLVFRKSEIKITQGDVFKDDNKFS